MIRKIHNFMIDKEEIKVWDLLWGDLLLLTQNYEEGLSHILLEFNSTIPALNADQLQHIFAKISSSTEHKGKGKWQKIEELVMMETFVMVHTHQSLHDIRNWTVQYFFLVSRCISVALGHKKADEVLNPESVDKGGIRDLTGGKREVIL